MTNNGEIERLQKKIQSLEDEITKVQNEKTEYLQNVSHQLVAPLNAIKWHIENLTSSRISVERAQKVLRSIYSQSTLAVHLAKNFSLMSNLEADHDLSALKEPLQEVELLPLLINLADDFQPLSWDKNINIIVDQERFSPNAIVLVIKPLISQVFSNIIENATKYSFPDSDVIIQCYLNQEKQAYTVHIKNRGVKISEEEKGRIFERGFRSKSAKEKYPAGTGFGLYIAKKIIEIHEGNIGLKHDSNMTVFYVELPIRALKGKARTRDAKNSTTY